MSKKKASASTKDDSNQTITNFYRLRSGDPAEEIMSDNMTNPGESITPSKGMETSGRDERAVLPQLTNILSSSSTGDAQMTISHQTVSETHAGTSNDTVVAMLNHMNKSLQKANEGARSKSRKKSFPESMRSPLGK